MPTYLSNSIDWAIATSSQADLCSRVKTSEPDTYEHILCDKLPLFLKLHQIGEMGFRMSGYSMQGESLLPWRQIEEKLTIFSKMAHRGDGNARVYAKFWMEDVPPRTRHPVGDCINYDIGHGSSRIEWSFLKRNRTISEFAALHRRAAAELVGNGCVTEEGDGVRIKFDKHKFHLTSEHGGAVSWEVGIPGSVNVVIHDHGIEGNWMRCISFAREISLNSTSRFELNVTDGLVFGIKRTPDAVASSYQSVLDDIPQMDHWNHGVYQLQIVSVSGACKATELEPEQASYFPLYQFEMDGSDEACQFAIVVGRKKPRIEIEAPKGVAKEQLEQLIGLPLKKA